MNPAIQPDVDPKSIIELAKRCTRLCEQADNAAGKLSKKREEFLSHSLHDSLQHLELILRILDEEEQSSPARQQKQSFLSRLFKREGGAADKFQPPKFDVAHQGFQGNSATVPLAELLSFLTFSGKTGVLWVDTPHENFLLGLVDGHLEHATSDNTPEGLRLGEILVGLGCLTRRQLERFLETHAESDVVSGVMLLESGMISNEELQTALVYQVQQLFRRVVDSDTAVFRFREGMQIMLAYKVQLDVNQLLLDCARAQDEVVGSTARSHHVREEWNSWQEDLTSQVTEAQSSASAEASAAPKSEATSKASTSSSPGSTQQPQGSTPSTGKHEASTKPAENKDSKSVSSESKTAPKSESKAEQGGASSKDTQAPKSGGASASSAKDDDKPEPPTPGATHGKQRRRRRPR